MDLIFSLHGRVAYALVLYYTLVGVWAIVQGVRDRGPDKSLRGAIAIATIAAVAQGVLGLLVLVFRGGPEDSVHILYGVALAVAMPLAGTLIRDRTPRGQSIALGIAALFTAGLAIRGITTA
jgi:MFS family permease